MKDSDCKGDPDLCDWLYDGGDSSVGQEAAWVCQICGAFDVGREPPSDPDADYIERNV